MTVKKYSDKAAFTLAEVLITLGIIGVVAALTLPTLVQNYEEKVTVTKMKKMYNVLSNAYTLYLSEDNPKINVQYNEEGAITIANIFLPYLKIARDCGTGDGTSCIYNGFYTNKNNSTAANYSNDSKYYKLVLSDGATIWFRAASPNIGIIQYDVNGKNPPNKWGYDLFEFNATDSSIIPASNFNNGCATANSNGHGCAIWIIQQGNMKYIKDHSLTLN